MLNRPRYGNPDCGRQPEGCWYTFGEMLRRLHAEGIYLHPEQLAEFLLAHGLPVDLDYVPQRLKAKAVQINTHYQGNMAQLEDTHGNSEEILALD